MNAEIDGVSCESAWCQSKIDSYIWGHWNVFSIVDTDNNFKNSRYHLIGGSCAAIMGSYVSYPWLLKMAGVFNKLCKIQDCDSDMLVLCLDSARTIEKLVNIECNDLKNMVVTCSSLFFTRTKLYGVNKNISDIKKYCCMHGIKCYG